MASTLIIRGENILEKPLFITDEAVAVEIYDSKNNLIALMHQIFTKDMWGVTTKEDEDWDEVLHQLGYIESVRKLKEQQN